MHLVFIRHAAADSADDHNGSDADRELTERGRKRFKAAARGIANLIDKPRAVLSSPLVRARQTAEIIATECDVEVEILPALSNGDWTAIWNRIRQFGDDDTVVLVGHEDWISSLTAELLGSSAGPSFAYRKGGAALLDIDRNHNDRATLVWFIPPGVFRAME